MMIRKTLLTVSFCGLLFMGAPRISLGQGGSGQPDQQSQQKATKYISGKVTDIGEQGDSFTVETDDSGGKRTMKFVVDENTRVQGQVNVGTLVAVDYQQTEEGQLVCLRVAPQNA